MIGLDTNVLLRVFVADNERKQHQRSLDLVSSHRSPMFVNAIVLSEATWTLSKRFKQSREDTAAFVERVLGAGIFVVMEAAAAHRALAGYRSGKAEFADYFIAEINAEAGCERTATFDRGASGHSHFQLVP